MRKVTRGSVVCLLCGIAALSANGQSVLGFQFPLGIGRQIATGPSLALGSAGTGMEGDFLGMAENPGNLGSINLAAFAAVASLDLVSIGENGNRTTTMGLAPRLLSFTFPFSSVGTLGFSVEQRTETDFRFRDSFPTDASGSSATAVLGDIDIGLASEGGTTIWQAGWGYRIGRFARAGLTYERVYFTNDVALVRHAMNTPPDSILLDSTKVVFRGNGFRAGVIVPIGQAAIGLSGEYILEGDASKSDFRKGAGRDISMVEHFSLQLPPSLALGASWRASPEWLLSAEASMTLWSRYESETTLGGASSFDNSYGFSAGTQFVPAPNLLSPRYWETMQYQAGARYSRLPLSTSSEYALNLGVGLPLSQGGGLFNVIFEYGRRTDESFGDYGEDFVSLQLGINGGRKWFQQSGSSY